MKLLTDFSVWPSRGLVQRWGNELIAEQRWLQGYFSTQFRSMHRFSAERASVCVIADELNWDVDRTDRDFIRVGRVFDMESYAGAGETGKIQMQVDLLKKGVYAIADTLNWPVAPFRDAFDACDQEGWNDRTETRRTGNRTRNLWAVLERYSRPSGLYLVLRAWNRNGDRFSGTIGYGRPGGHTLEGGERYRIRWLTADCLCLYFGDIHCSLVHLVETPEGIRVGLWRDLQKDFRQFKECARKLEAGGNLTARDLTHFSTKFPFPDPPAFSGL